MNQEMEWLSNAPLSTSKEPHTKITVTHCRSSKWSIVEDEIGDVQLNIFEPPRFFEGFLVGRGYQETVDITARICGICPVAYQMSAAHALEKALGMPPPPGVRELRRLLYLGEWIESHSLHVYMLHAPDFVGYESAISMAANPDLRPLVEQGLRMKKVGNSLMTIIGGRGRSRDPPSFRLCRWFLSGAKEVRTVTPQA